jgi:hypothetical protein
VLDEDCVIEFDGNELVDIPDFVIDIVVDSVFIPD